MERAQPADYLAAIPDHVPPDLLYHFPFRRGVILDDGTTPFDVIDDAVAHAPPIFWAPGVDVRDGWVVTDGRIVAELLGDLTHFSRRAKNVFRFTRNEALRDIVLVPSATNEPEHHTYRKMFNPTFAPRYIAQLEDHARRTAREFVTRFREHGECEFIAQFGRAFPIRIFLEFMDLPLEMTDRFIELGHTLIQGADLDSISAALDEVCDVMLTHIAVRRRRPGEDLISRALASEFRGRRLDEQELLGHCVNLFMGGMDTVTTTLSHLVVWLATHPEAQTWLREHPESSAVAVNELTRLAGVINQYRHCRKPIVVAGQQILPGDSIVFPTAVANRDPALFDEPATARFDRHSKHFTYGTGAPICLGMPLARLELRIALEELLCELPQFAIQPGHTVAYNMGGVAQPVAVPLRW